MTWRANKSQFPKMPIPKGSKKQSRIYIDPEDFILMRHRAFLTTQKAATYLDVTHKTLLNWEKGQSRIPYTAFRVLKLKVGYVFDDDHFGDWFVRGDTLWSPEGRGFKPHELRYIGNYFWMARRWLAERKAAKPQNQLNATIERGAASDSPPTSAGRAPFGRPSVDVGPPSSFGAEPPQQATVDIERLQVSREKPADFERFLASLGIAA